VHAICEEYRAAATIDVEHDREDRLAGSRFSCPVLAYGAAADRWRPGTTALEGHPVCGAAGRTMYGGGPLDGGHFFPEELPDETAHRLTEFFRP
jgi:haloacetate dehalogenase